MPDAVDGRAESVRRALDEFLGRLAEAVMGGSWGHPLPLPSRKEPRSRPLIRRTTSDIPCRPGNPPKRARTPPRPLVGDRVRR